MGEIPLIIQSKQISLNIITVYTTINHQFLWVEHYCIHLNNYKAKPKSQYARDNKNNNN